jgi:glutaminyl-tRNA synthetase
MANETGSSHFIDDIIQDDARSGKHGGRVATRFPPEPNGYLHIGHAKSICLNFGMASTYAGTCNLRFDDTNPAKEDIEYVDSIMEDVRWLGFDWEQRLFYASDYFERLYEQAVALIRLDKAYVCDLTGDQVSEFRGNFHKPGRNSPFRDRTVDENLDLFARMRVGEFADGARTLRAKIDMASPNMNMRDPPMYRIKRSHHHRTGDTWCIYPMYDFAHCFSDAFEGITHSLCTLEFEDHRALYDWFLAQVEFPHRPQQIEFARLALTYTVLSKRKLLELVTTGLVSGWDDPRMPTISGYRRRGYTPESIRNFAERIGVARRDGLIDVALLEHAIREDLEPKAARVMGVLDPLKVVLTNLPEGEIVWLDAPFHPENPEMGSRRVPLTRELWIEQDDFREEPPKKFFRLAPGREVRLRYGCLITCNELVKDADGKVIELRCTWDPDSKGGNAPDGRKVKGTLHWVSASHGVQAEVRLYDRLFRSENPADDKDGGDWKNGLNPESLQVLPVCYVEPSLADAAPGGRFQFERLGYFCADKDARPGKPVFNRTVALRDSWAKAEAKE